MKMKKNLSEILFLIEMTRFYLLNVVKCLRLFFVFTSIYHQLLFLIVNQDEEKTSPVLKSAANSRWSKNNHHLFNRNMANAFLHFFTAK